MSDPQLLLLSLLGLLPSLYHYLQQLESPGPPQRLRLAVAVFSRLHSMERRMTIRNTWRKRTEDDVEFAFVLGASSCPLPMLWRLEPDSCKDWELKVPGWIDDNVPLMLPEEDRSMHRGLGSAYQGFVFKVMHFPIMVEALGLQVSLLTSLAELSNSSLIYVELCDRLSNQIIYQVHFNISDVTNTRKSDGYLYKSVQNRHIPLDNFDGILNSKLVTTDTTDVLRMPAKCAVRNSEDFGKIGLVHMTGLVDSNSTVVPISRYACPLVSLQYSILDPDGLKRLHRSKKQQIEMEEMKNKDLRRRANLEEEEHNDIIFLPVIDSNETDCEKFQLLSKYAVENMAFDNLLLVDDDTFVFLDNLVDQLNNHAAENLWWGHFEANTKRGNTRTTLIPTFPVPKSPSMVVSRRLVQYISHNSLYLRNFNSLLSSLSIWFASIDTKVVDDDHWSEEMPENGEIPSTKMPSIAFQNISPSQMKQLWATLNRH